MKRYLSLFFISSSLFISCSKEELRNEISADVVKVGAHVENFNTDTKAAVSDEGTFKWQEGDRITVYTSQSNRLISDPLGEVDSNSALFGFTGWNNTYTIGIYPDDVAYNGKITLPEERMWKQNNATPIMMASYKDGGYIFKHLGAVVKVQIQNIPTNATSFKFSTSGYQINGVFSVINGQINTTKVTNGSDTYTLTFDAPNQANTTMDFYVPLPVGTYESGFRVTLLDDSQKVIYEKKGSTSQNVGLRQLIKMTPITIASASGEDTTIDISDATSALVTSDNINVKVPEKPEKPIITLPVENTADKTINIAFESIETESPITISAKDNANVAANVNITVPTNADAAKLYIDLPNSTVTIIASGSGAIISEITAATADNTLVIENNVEIQSLIVRQGNVRVKSGARIDNWSRPAKWEAKGFIYVEEGAFYPNSALDGYEVITPEDIVAKVEGVGYKSLQEAIKAVQAKGRVSLEKDITLSEILTIDKSNFTLDGNNKTLKSTAGRAINVSGATAVTIQNLKIDATGERAINIIQKSTNIIIENVTATAYNYTVNVAGSAPAAKVTISNSNLTGKNVVNVSGAGSDVTLKNSIVNCIDNNTTAGEDYAALCLNKDAVNGSIIAKSDSNINVTEGSDSVKGRNGADGGTVLINGSTDGVEVTVAFIPSDGDNYYDFSSLAEAIEFAKSGQTVELIRNVELNEALVIPTDKNITLDLNGKSISHSVECTKSYNMVTNYGNLTITGDGKLSFTDTSAGGGSRWGSYTIFNYGTLIVENGTIEHLGSTSDWGTDRPTNIPINNYKGKVVVNGGEISSPQFRSLRDFAPGGEIIINDGTFKGQVWMQCCSQGEQSSLIITGGSFMPTAGYDGSSVYIGNELCDVKMSVKGGYFNTKIGVKDDTKAGVSGSVIGGTFTTAAKEGTSIKLLGTGYAFVDNDNDTWTVKNQQI